MANKKDLVGQLKRENQRLKRELAKYRKYSNKFADIIIESWGESSEDNEEDSTKSKKIVYCDRCGKGELKEISVLGIEFLVCQLCKFRKKLR